MAYIVKSSLEIKSTIVPWNELENEKLIQEKKEYLAKKKEKEEVKTEVSVKNEKEIEEKEEKKEKEEEEQRTLKNGKKNQKAGEK